MTRIIAHRLAGLARRPIGISLMARISLYRQRRSLADLDEHMLKDLGITKREAFLESERPIWDAPANWKR